MNQTAAQLGPITQILAATPGATVLAPTRALIASADMTADVTMTDGGDVNGVPLNRGINAISVTKVRAVAGGTVQLGY